MVVGAAAGVTAAGTLAAGYFQNKASKKANKANLANQAGALAYNKEMLGKAEMANLAGIRAAEAGFGKATSSLGMIGEVSRGRILRRETARLGASDAAAAKRGLYSSTRALGARRAIQSDTDLTLAGIDESVAAMHSQVFRDRARTLMQGHIARQGLYGQFAGLNMQGQFAYPHQAANVGGGISAATGSLAQLLMAFGSGGSGSGGGLGGGVFDEEGAIINQ